MGFRSEAIFMKPRISEAEELELLQKMGFGEYIYEGKVPFEDADGHNRNGVYIGHCNESTYVIFEGIVLNHYNRKNPWEKALQDIYPEKEFLSIMNYEVACGYFYHYYKNGKTIRRKSGDDAFQYFNEGEELEIEKAYYEKKEVIDGEEFFYTKPWNEHETELDRWQACQIGGEVAFRLVEMIAGVHYCDDLIFDSELNQYVSKEKPSEPENSSQKPAESQSSFEKPLGPTPTFSSNAKPLPIHINYPTGFHPVEDNITVITSIELSATPDQIWQALIQIKQWDEWHPQTYNIRIVSTDTGRLKPRTRFRWNTAGIHLLSQVIDFQPARALSWISQGTGIKAFHAWQIIPTAEGTKVILEHTQKGWLSRLSHFFNPKKMEQYHLNWLECLQEKLQ